MSGDQHVQQTFAGLKVSPIRLESFLSLVQGSICGGDRLTVTYLNPDYARRALRRESLRQDINEFDLVLVDGNGVRIMAPLFGFTVPERLDTDSVAPPLWQLLSTFKAKVFLFGCAPGVADDASRRLQDAFPGVQVVGTEHGFYDVQRGHPGTFSQEDTDLVIKRITAAEPDLPIGESADTNATELGRGAWSQAPGAGDHDWRLLSRPLGGARRRELVPGVGGAVAVELALPTGSRATPAVASV